MAEGGANSSFPVRGNVEIGGELIGNLGRWPAIHRNFHQAVATGTFLVDHPSIRGANGILIEVAVGKLLEIATGGVHAPDIQSAASFAEDAENEEAAVRTRRKRIGNCVLRQG